MNYRFLMIAIVVVLASCKKETTYPPDSYDMPRTEGSYWVYQWSQIDSMGIAGPVLFTDTVTITGSVSLNGNTYAEYSGTHMGHPTNWLQRDSSNYIVDEHGSIRYSFFPGTVLAEFDSNPYHQLYKMGPIETIAHPLGAFTAIDKQQIISNLDGTPVNSCSGMTHTFHNYYVSGIGEIREETAYIGALQSECKILRKNLISYHIVP